MKSLSKRERLLIVAMLFITILYVYFRLFLSPVINQISLLDSNIGNYNNQLNQLKIKSVSNQKLQTQLEQLQEKFKAEIEALPQSARDPEISYNLKLNADKSKVILNNISFGQSGDYSMQQSATVSKQNAGVQLSQGEKLMYFPVTLVVSGDYNSLLNFIILLENSNRIAEVTNISISKGAAGVQANLNLNYYFSGSIDGSSSNPLKYDFNTGTYGKEDLFK